MRRLLYFFLCAIACGKITALLAHTASSGTEYFTWTTGGRALSKTNARGTVSGYFYGSTTSGVVAGAGDLTDITYADSTPQITYTYDRLGRMATAIRDGITRTVSLTLHGQQESEAWTNGPLDGLTLDPGFDSLRRRNALAVTGSGGTVPSQSYGYDALTGELSTISSTGPGVTGAVSATYAYEANTRLLAGVTFANASTTRLTQARSYDNLNRLTAVTSTAGSTAVSASDYTLNASGQRSRTVLADGTWWKYTYDTHGQVTSAERRRVAGSTPADTDPVLPGQTFSYAYDGLGNRTAAIQGDGGVTAAHRRRHRQCRSLRHRHRQRRQRPPRRPVVGPERLHLLRQFRRLAEFLRGRHPRRYHRPRGLLTPRPPVHRLPAIRRRWQPNR